jgi:hypothetical protein
VCQSEVQLTFYRFQLQKCLQKWFQDTGNSNLKIHCCSLMSLLKTKFGDIFAYVTLHKVYGFQTHDTENKYHFITSNFRKTLLYDEICRAFPKK